MHSQLPYSRYCSFKFELFSYFSLAIMQLLRQKINFWKIKLNLLEKAANLYYSKLLLCLDNSAATRYLLRVTNML